MLTVIIFSRINTLYFHITWPFRYCNPQPKSVLYKYLILYLVATCSIWTAKAQDTLVVDSNNSQYGLLNETIASDTTATGERVHTVYILKRGHTYLLSGEISNISPYGIPFSLKIMAEDSDGPRPRIISELSSRPFRVHEDLTLKGLYITGMDEQGGLNVAQRIIRISAPEVQVIVDDCHLDQDGQSAFRVDSPGLKLYLTNSIISNIGRPNNSDWGHVIDDRGNDIDTIIMENNTIYNVATTVMNGRGGWIKYAKINQNTIVHTGQRIFDFDETQTTIFTNNLIINPGYLGKMDNPDNSTSTGNDLEALITIDSLSGQSQAQLPEVAQTFICTNNNIAWHDEIIGAWAIEPTMYAGTDHPIVQRQIFNTTARAMAGEEQLVTNIREVVSFDNAPPVDDLVMIIDQFWADPNEINSKYSVQDWDISQEPFDFSFDKSFISASTSTENGTLGDLQWPVNNDCDDIHAIEEVLPEQLILYLNSEAKANLTKNMLIGDIELCDNTQFSFAPSTFEFSDDQDHQMVEVIVNQGLSIYIDSISVALFDRVPPTITVDEEIFVALDAEGKAIFDLHSLPEGMEVTDNTGVSHIFIKETLTCNSNEPFSVYVFAEDIFNNVDSALVNVLVSCPLSLNQDNRESSKHVLDVYPNPVANTLYFELQNDTGQQLDISLRDLGGKRIFAPILQRGNQVSLDLSTLKPGLYLLTVDDGIQRTTSKVIKSLN